LGTLTEIKPRPPKHTEQAQSVSHELEMSYSSRILSVDDDPSISKAISSVLKSKGYLVDTAGNGAETIEKAERDFYSLAFVGMCRPDTNGLEVLTAISKIGPRTPKIPPTRYHLCRTQSRPLTEAL
jgi:DNA-binding NtrC family response regulator